MKCAAVKCAAVALWVLVGCEPLVDDGYRGPALLAIDGGFDKQLDKGLSSRDDLRAAVMWTGDLGPATPGEGWMEQPGSSQPVSLPGPLRFRLFERPSPSEHAHAAGRLAVGRVVLYVDYDDDGLRDDDEPLLGGLTEHAILHALEPLGADVPPLYRDIPAGFHVVRLPLACAPLTPPEGKSACDVPLGARCESDAECRDGLCLDDARLDWAQASCALPASAGCSLTAAGYLASVEPAEASWLRPCRSTSDCGGGRVTCDVGAGGCAPVPRYRALVVEGPSYLPLCAPPSDAGP